MKSIFVPIFLTLTLQGLLTLLGLVVLTGCVVRPARVHLEWPVYVEPHRGYAPAYPAY
jgi:hypothetical protein